MEIQMMAVGELTPYAKNTKKHDQRQIDNVAESIKQYGFVQPIVIDKDNVVVIGHCRLLAAKKLKMREVPCVSVDDLTEEQVRALRIVDNKSNESEWDFDFLVDELAELDLSDFDFDFGIEDEEEQTEIVEDEAPEVDEERAVETLREKFIVPPFGVIDTRKGEYQKRKKAWKAIIKDNGEARGLNNTGKTALCKNMISKNLSDVSLLDPVLSEIICSWFTPKGKSVCIDCFAGDTVFGFVSGYLGNRFIGIELRKEQADFNNEHTNENAIYYCDDGRNIRKYVEDNTADLLFSCPPYFDLEVYSDLPNDASNQETYEDFYKILDEAFTEAVKCLKENRFAIVVASDIRKKDGKYYDFCGDIKKTFLKNGFGLYNEFILYTLNVSGYMRASKQFGKFRKMIKDYQNVMVFYKGDHKHIPKYFSEIEVADIESKDLELQEMD